MNMKEIQQVTAGAIIMADNDKFVTKYISNGMMYTITCRPITDKDFVSVRDYLGYKPDRELAEQIARKARATRQQYVTETVVSPSYQGKVLLYTPEFLDAFFKTIPKTPHEITKNVDMPACDTDIDESLPF